MLFGCCIPSRQYEQAIQAGFDYVEFSGVELSGLSEEAFARLERTVRQGGVPCLAVNSYCDGRLPIVGDAVPEEDRIRDYAGLVCGRARALGARMAGIGAPAARRLPPGYDPGKADRQCVRFLTVTAEAAAGYGIRVNFEPLHIRTCNYGNRTDEAAALVRGLGMENVGLVADFYHRGVMGEEPGALTDIRKLIGHTHISTCGPAYERGYPGMGDLAYYARVLAALVGVGYRRTMSVEAHTDDLLREGRACLEMLRLAEKGAEKRR